MPTTKPQTLRTDAFSTARLGRMHEVMVGYADRGEVPGMVTAVSRWGEVHVEATGTKETMDHLTPEQKTASSIFFGDNRGWGFGMAVYTDPQKS